MPGNSTYGGTTYPRIPMNIEAFVQEVRLYMRDFPELNRLIEGEESSDRMILWAVIDALEDFNASPPPITFTFDEIPKSILRYAVVTTLLESVILLSARNSLAYSDGGINVNLDKTPLLMQLREMMRGTYEMRRDKFKVAQNIARCYDAAPSEYMVLSGYGPW